MTEAEFLDLPESERDLFVAKAIFGWTQGMYEFDGKMEQAWRDNKNKTLYRYTQIPSFTTDIAAAWEVLTSFATWNLRKLEVDRHYVANILLDTGASTESAPLAICIAALKAKGAIA